MKAPLSTKIVGLYLWFFVFLLGSICGAESVQPPTNIIEHFEWCKAPQKTVARVVRYEGFWKRYHPVSEEYEDAIHVNFVRFCAYRLAALYADTGDAKKGREMVKGLEAQDSSLPK